MGAGERMEAGWDKAKGKVKEGIGDMTDNEKMEAEGKMNQAEGEIKETKEDVKDSVKDAFND